MGIKSHATNSSDCLIGTEKPRMAWRVWQVQNGQHPKCNSNDLPPVRYALLLTDYIRDATYTFDDEDPWPA